MKGTFMKLQIRNIGKIKDADVLINGITVIAGENNTGKSTIGKALYAIFSAFAGVDEKVNNERIESILKALYILIQELSKAGDMDESRDWVQVAREIGNLRLSQGFTKEMLQQYLKDVLAVKKIDDAKYAVHVNNIMRILKVSDADYLKVLTQQNFADEFNQQINNMLDNTTGDVTLTIKDKVSSVSFYDNSVVKIDKTIDIFSEAIYLDDPFIIDVSPKRAVLGSLLGVKHFYGHKDRLVDIIYSQYTNNNLIDKIVVSERIDRVIKKLHEACVGQAFFKDSTNLMYRQENTGATFKIGNLSTGLKSFVILQILLLSGEIKDGSLLIFDEPEIHLHPEWQLLFAELIVMLQEEFDLHILLNTHSPYFLNDIDVYAQRHKVINKCEYYLSYNKNDESYIERVTDNIDLIYSKLARPMQLLENLRYTLDE